MTAPAERRRSGLYVGKVRHRRYRPKEHELSYRVWHLLLDLDELDDLNRDVRGFGRNRRALVEFRDADHFDPSPGGFSGFGARANRRGRGDQRPVRDKLRSLLAARDVELPDGPVQVLTYPRVLGFTFNPVSFWYCHDRDGALQVIVAEVNNTFGDAWSYVLTDLEPIPGGGIRAHAQKVLHVSPFLPIEDHEYTFTIRPPVAADGSRQAVHMDVLAPDPDVAELTKILDATLVESREPLTSRSLLRAFVTHPLVTLHTVIGIHWQAAKLWFGRKARFHGRPEPTPWPGVD